MFVLTLIFTPLKAQATDKNYYNDTKSTCDLNMAERQLWIEHVLWTRDFIKSDLSSLEDKDVVLERLLKNQDDIGNSIKPYYGEEAGNKLAVLLREHIEVAVQVVDTAKVGNKADLDKYNKLWYENAGQIADFLNSANPNYSNKTLKDMLHKHLQSITDQAVARVNKDWKSNIESYDKGQEHMINFDDVLSNGIIKQLPKNLNN